MRAAGQPVSLNLPDRVASRSGLTLDMANRMLTSLPSRRPGGSNRRRPGLWACRAVAFWLLLACCSQGFPEGSEPGPSSPKGLRVVDLNGRSVSPFEAKEARAFVFIFVSLECPISNSYMPEYQRLAEEFAPKGFAFKLIYPNADETADAIQKHLKEYKCSLNALRDPHHELVKAASARVTPEAAVFVPERGLVYHGRIDDRHVALGKARPAARTHDLRDTLAAILGGKLAQPRVTPAVGCYISGTP